MFFISVLHASFETCVKTLRDLKNLNLQKPQKPEKPAEREKPDKLRTTPKISKPSKTQKPRNLKKTRKPHTPQKPQVPKPRKNLKYFANFGKLRNAKDSLTQDRSRHVERAPAGIDPRTFRMRSGSDTTRPRGRRGPERQGATLNALPPGLLAKPCPAPNLKAGGRIWRSTHAPQHTSV